MVLCNALRPSWFFNSNDLHFGLRTVSGLPRSRARRGRNCSISICYHLIGVSGVETDSGQAESALGMLAETIADGCSRRSWILTMYATLTNYRHSLGRKLFAVAVFDETQVLKNPVSMCSCAGRALKADFRTGLTGTLVENRPGDLWAIPDQVGPGTPGT